MHHECAKHFRFCATNPAHDGGQRFRMRIGIGNHRRKGLQHGSGVHVGISRFSEGQIRLFFWGAACRLKGKGHCEVGILLAKGLRVCPNVGELLGLKPARASA